VGRGGAANGRELTGIDGSFFLFLLLIYEHMAVYLAVSLWLFLK